MSYTYTISDTCNNFITLYNNQSILVTSTGTCDNTNDNFDSTIYTQGNNILIVNNGTITTASTIQYGIYNVGTISNLYNYGNISGATAGIYNTGTITNLYNSQNNLIFWYGINLYNGLFPTNYYIKINSGSNYGSINGNGVQGTMNFNIDPSSIIDPNQLTYANVLNVIANDHLNGATGSGLNYTLTGTFNNYDWTLSTSNNSNWNLTFSSIFSSINNDNIYILTNPNELLESNLTIPNRENIIIPKDYTLTISPNIVINNSGALINYGIINISSGAAINNTSSGIILNEFSGTIINNSISNSNTNSGKIINRGSFSNELSSSTFTNGSGGIFLNKNGGTFDNTGTVINEPGGVFDNYYNYLRVNNGGQVVNYGQYINDIIYEPGTPIIPPYSLIAAGSNHSLGLQYGVSGDLYAWGNNISGQLGNDDALYDISSSTPILVLNGPEYIQPPQILANTVQYHYAIRTSNTITSSSTPTSSNILDISVNSLSLTFSEYGYWDISGSIITIYGIQGNFSDISYSSIFQGGNCNLLGSATNVINSISSSTINPSAYNLIITLSSYTNNFVNNNGNNAVTLTSNPTYPSTSNFLAPGTGATLTLPNTITTDPSFTVIIPQDQSYTLSNYTYSGNTPTFSFISTAPPISPYTINVGNSLSFNLNQLLNYDISSVVTSSITITPPSPSGNTIDDIEYDATSLSLFIAVDNSLTDTFPYLNGVTLISTTSSPLVSLNISSVSIKQTLTATLLDLVVSTTPANIPLIVADISNNPRLTYTLTTLPSLSISQPLDISTNTIGSGTLTVTTTTTPAYNFALPLGIVGHSTFTINTPVNLIAPTTQFQGYFTADFSFNISYDVSPAPPSDLCGNQWISVASGGNTSFGLRDGGYLYAWGDNTSGHLGTGDVVDTSKNYPTQVDLSNCIGVASGLNHALALDDINDLWAWGDNTYGQLGNISNNNSISPIVIYDYINTTTQTITTTQDITIPANVYSINLRITGEQGSSPYSEFQKPGGFGAIVNVYNYPVIPNDKITFSINSLLGGVSSWTDQANNTYNQNGGSGSFVYINDNSSVGQGLIAVAGGGSGGITPERAGVDAGTDKENNNGIGGSGGIYPNNPANNGSNGLDFINLGKGGDGAGGNAGIQYEILPGSGGGGGYGGGGGGTYAISTSIKATGGNGGFSNGGASDGINNSGGAGGSYASNGAYNTIRTNTVSYSQTHYIQFNYFNTSISKYKNIACGDNHSLAIDFSNNLYTWGNNSSGQLGLGPTPDTSRNYPSLVATPSSAYWLKAVGGSNHSLGLQSDGSLWAWGDNTYGQLGNGQSGLSSNVPISVTNPLPSNIRWVDIAAGANVSMAITNTNQLYAWGSDISGQIGIVNPPYTTPQLISSPSNFIKCAIGGSHSLGISLNDSSYNLYAWGTNTYGQLGIGNTTTQYVPQPVLPPLNPILNTF